jgi:hypothetical protein
MKRTISVMALVLLAAASYAGQARLAAMPGSSEFLLDDGDIFAHPTLAAYYYRNLSADLGADTSGLASNSSLLATYAGPEQSWGVAGLAINHGSPAQRSFTLYLDPCADSLFTNNLIERLQNHGAAYNLPDIPLPGRELDLIFTRRLNESWSWGVRLERASGQTAYSYSEVATDASSSATGLTLSAGYEPSDDMRGDLGISYVRLSCQSNYSLSALDSSQHLTSRGLGHISGRGRLFYNLNNDMVLVPLVSFSYLDLGYDYDKNFTLVVAGGGTKASGFRLGCGWQYRPDSKATFVAGLSTGAEDTTASDSLVYSLLEYHSSAWVTAISLGLEYSLNGWLTARLGGSQELLARSLERTLTDGTVIKTEEYSEPYRLGLGLALRLRGLVMDLEVNPKLLYSGGQLVSGSEHWPVARASLNFRY